MGKATVVFKWQSVILKCNERMYKRNSLIIKDVTEAFCLEYLEIKPREYNYLQNGLLEISKVAFVFVRKAEEVDKDQEIDGFSGTDTALRWTRSLHDHYLTYIRSFCYVIASTSRVAWCTHHCVYYIV